jgi:methionyl aminopeptidase
MSAPICIFTEEQFPHMRRAGALAGEILHLVGEKVRPGVTLLELDTFAEEWIRDQGATPTFKGYMGFPSTLCTSVNENIVHGIPTDRELKVGDLVSIDVGVTVTEDFNGKPFTYVGDNAFTFPCGEISPKSKRLLKATNAALWAGLEVIQAGKHISDIAAAIEAVAKEYRFGNVKEFGGHGIGPSYHCQPFIPNFLEYFNHFPDDEIKIGMVLAIEPMLNIGGSAIKKHKDGWTIMTADRKNSAHFEHSALITSSGVEIITDVEKTKNIFHHFDE